MQRGQIACTYCKHELSFHGYWAHTLPKKCWFKSTNHYIDLPKQYPWGYISNLLKRLITQYDLAVAVGPVCGLALSQSRYLCDSLMHTMHPRAKIHNVMSELTGNANKTSEQHRGLEVARRTRDVNNLQIIHSWFTEKFPFPEKAELMLISKALTAPQHLISTVIKPMKLVQKFMPR